MTFSLAHLTDPHLPLPGRMPPLFHLRPKQELALLSWRRKRRLISTTVPLEALLADLEAQAPDHLAVTGDLVNLAAPAEMAAARCWLERLGEPDRVSVVPGNHDCTVPAPWPDGIGQWEPWMRGDADPGPGAAPRFPFLRRRGPLALICLSSAVPTPLFLASGRVGPQQLLQAGAWLQQTARDGLFRVVLIHHPPVIGEGGRRKALRDRSGLAGLLRRHGAELVLHGHHHVSRLAFLPGPAGPIPVIGLPSASAGLARPELARWHLHGVERDGAGWRLTTTARRYDPSSGQFRAAGSWTLRIDSAGPAGPGQ
ncbi:metallophosphoesterase [Lichenicola cladoniae]|uniref:Metallophosphoesterase n=1 Tax=Lichenicola cladoniae TaxID=1484109 RepID=A0A6M8HTW5_9PROT|nr:metallophosphoesterase [Lichenicola cladoniae]NPD67573.1 metallophosphoesterase [Acetobacteraceae bacterium]QKE91782.1 metallophosphoesterase [Lichenicola cladoniae]